MSVKKLRNINHIKATLIFTVRKREHVYITALYSPVSLRAKTTRNSAKKLSRMGGKPPLYPPAPIPENSGPIATLPPARVNTQPPSFTHHRSYLSHSACRALRNTHRDAQISEVATSMRLAADGGDDDNRRRISRRDYSDARACCMQAAAHKTPVKGSKTSARTLTVKTFQRIVAPPPPRKLCLY